jgi:hypothetical protein
VAVPPSLIIEVRIKAFNVVIITKLFHIEFCLYSF